MTIRISIPQRYNLFLKLYSGAHRTCTPCAEHVKECRGHPEIQEKKILHQYRWQSRLRDTTKSVGNALSHNRCTQRIWTTEQYHPITLFLWPLSRIPTVCAKAFTHSSTTSPEQQNCQRKIFQILTSEEVAAIDKRKERLTSSPVLALPNRAITSRKIQTCEMFRTDVFGCRRCQGKQQNQSDNLHVSWLGLKMGSAQLSADGLR